MKLCIRISKSEHGGFVACCPSLPGCVTRGKTKEQARENIGEAIKGYLASVGDFVPENIANEVILEV
ncbi:MAG: type II toxin-antitoxin system HicB family antitoxin [Planctomycetes bacterium]|nr:type II toxin-antitoxin system HicB family antitoxin [Planctomycetota bacterium]